MSQHSPRQVAADRRAWTNRETRIRCIGVDPIYAPMRARSCFVQFLEEMELDQLAAATH